MTGSNRKTKANNTLIHNMKKHYQLYLLILPTVVYFLVFKYQPMYGVQIAFKNFIATEGILGSPFIGFEHFSRFFRSASFERVISNTLGINLYSLVVDFPLTVIFALLLNEVRHKYYKKTVQLITYAPHFISVVVMAGMILIFLSPSTGLINNIISYFGGARMNFIAQPKWFKTIFVFSGIWQSLGWGTIIYIAALSGIDYELHEAAIIDGATRLQRIWYVNIPGILPTVVILLILRVGQLMDVGFQKVFLLQNDLNMSASDVISTYVYRVGLLGAEFSFSSAVGLFNSVINFVLLISVNSIAKRISKTSLW